MKSEKLKVGDKVFIRTRWNSQIDAIVRETKTRFYTNYYSFHKKNSALVGYCGYKAVKATQEHFDMFEKSNIAKQLSNFDFDRLSLDVLRKIYQKVQEHSAV